MRVEGIDAYLETLDVSAANRLAHSLSRTAVGNGLEDYVTPLIPDGDPDYWRYVISNEVFSKLRLENFSWLKDAEEAQKAKIGSYSQQLPYTERRDDVMSYFATNKGNPDLDTLREAIRRVDQIMPKSINAVSLDDSVTKMPRGTNLGAPFFTSDERYIPDVARMAKQIETQGFKLSPLNLPALMFWRGQPKGLGQVSKNRTVWGVSHITIAHGLRVQIALLHYLRQRVEFAAWNASDIIDRAVTSAFQTSRRQIISVDFSRYDASLHPLLLEGAWELIRRSFPFDRKLVTWLQEQLSEVPLLTPEGMITGVHSMPSGDANTNLIDGLCQLILWNYIALKLRVQLLFATVQGDDGIVIFSKPIDVEEASSIITTDFGMTMSAEKGLVDPDNVHFLQNVHNRYYISNGVSVHVRPIMRALNGMLSYERLVKKSQGWNGYIDTMRWWQQVENCKWHPSFEVLVRYLYQHDKYSQLSVDEVVQRAGGLGKVARALKQPSFPYGKEPLTGVRGYKTVQLLQKLRDHSQEAAEPRE